MKLLWNLLALIGLVAVAAGIWLFIEFGHYYTDYKKLDPKAGQVYFNMMDTLLSTGDAAAATTVITPVADGVTAEEVEDTMRLVANELNIKNVGELPLSKEVENITGEPQPYLKIYMFCNPVTAAKMYKYSIALSSYLPCRIALGEDSRDKKLYLMSLNMDMMIHGGKPLPPELMAEAQKVKDAIDEIVKRGAAGDF